MKLGWEFPYDKPIIAVDFDGTLTEKDTRRWKKNKCLGPDVMVPNMELIDFLVNHRDKFYLILWTNRYGKHLRSAVRFCKEHDLEFDAVNKNLVPFKSSRKIVADYYLDDKVIKVQEMEIMHYDWNQ